MSNSSSSRKKKPPTQADLAKRALEMKQKVEREPGSNIPESRTSGEGQVHEARPDEPTMGALDTEGHRPVLERSRKVR